MPFTLGGLTALHTQLIDCCNKYTKIFFMAKQKVISNTVKTKKSFREILKKKGIIKGELLCSTIIKPSEIVFNLDELMPH